MPLLDESLWDLYGRRIISADDMLIRAQRPEEIAEKLSETAEGREALKRARGLVDESDLKAFQRTPAR